MRTTAFVALASSLVGRDDAVRDLVADRLQQPRNRRDLVGLLVRLQLAHDAVAAHRQHAARQPFARAARPVTRVGFANFRDQLARSATSVAANYAEACASESRRDFASRMAKALKEAKESRMWLFLLSRRGFFAEGWTRPLLDEANAIVRILGKGVSTTRRRMAEESGAPDPVDKDGQ